MTESLTAPASASTSLWNIVEVVTWLLPSSCRRCKGKFDLQIILHQNLNKSIRRFFNERFVWSVLQQVATALDVCHYRRGGSILHRDLKPGNVLLDSTCTHVKLADFGLAKVLSDDTVCARSHVGTPSYMSPEQVRSDMYDAKSDIWSLGCLMYEMATLTPPFRAKNPLLLARKITEGKFSPLPEHYSFELRDLISSMLELHPKRRPSVETVLRLCEASPVSSPLSSRSLSDMSEELEQRERSLSAREAELREMERRLQSDAKALKKRELALQARERSLQKRESEEFLTPTHSRPRSAPREPKLLQRLRCRLESPPGEAGDNEPKPLPLKKKKPKQDDKKQVGATPNCQQESLAQQLLSRLTLTELRRDLDVAANRLDPARRRVEHRASLRV